ncbi:MAG TPA: DNA polymerase III subunit [Terriglobales bacterium]|nr:DNA polymerase III subunit [Terriglobales bacterium]
MKNTDCWDIAGGEEALSRLSDMAASDRPPHALLIAGPAGVGKRTAALVFAKAVMCPHRQGHLACGVCRVCTSFDAGTNPDLTVVDCEKSIKVEAVRELRELACANPVSAVRRVFVIMDADKMTPQAQNALLKLFEEPPPHLVIVLTAVSADALLPTVRSRAAEVRMGPMSATEITAFLRRKNPKADPAKIEAAARLSGGLVGKAAALMRKRSQPEDLGAGAAAKLFAGDKYGLLSLANKIAASKEDFAAACDGMVRAGAAALASGDAPAAGAGALVHVTEKYRRIAEGNAALPLLCTAMLLEIWRDTYDNGLRSPV